MPELRAAALLDGFMLVSGDVDGAISLWHSSSREVIRSSPVHAEAIAALLPLTSAPSVPRRSAAATAAGGAAGEAAGEEGVPGGGDTPSASPPASPTSPGGGSPDGGGAAKSATSRWQSGGGAAGAGATVKGGVDPNDPRLPSLLLSVCIDGTVSLWDTSGYRLMPHGSFHLGEFGVSCAALRTTHTLVVGFDHGGVHMWRLPEVPLPEVGGEGSSRRLNPAAKEAAPAPALCLGAAELHAGRVTSLSCSRDGRLLLSSSLDHTAALWSLADFAPLRTFVFSRPCNHAVCLHPPTAFIAALGDSLETVPIPEAALPPLADAEAMDAAALLLAAGATSPARRLAAPRRPPHPKHAREAARAWAMREPPPASRVGSEIADEDVWGAIDEGEARRLGLGLDDDDEEEEAGAAAAAARRRRRRRRPEGKGGHLVAAALDEGGADNEDGGDGGGGGGGAAQTARRARRRRRPRGARRPEVKKSFSIVLGPTGAPDRAVAGAARGPPRPNPRRARPRRRRRARPVGGVRRRRRASPRRGPEGNPPAGLPRARRHRPVAAGGAAAAASSRTRPRRPSTRGRSSGPIRRSSGGACSER